MAHWQSCFYCSSFLDLEFNGYHFFLKKELPLQWCEDVSPSGHQHVYVFIPIDKAYIEATGCSLQEAIDNLIDMLKIVFTTMLDQMENMKAEPDYFRHKLVQFDVLGEYIGYESI